MGISSSCLRSLFDNKKCLLEIHSFDTIANGELAEWSNAAVLKTVVPKGTRGSNPLLSARDYFTYNPKFVNSQT